MMAAQRLQFPMLHALLEGLAVDLSKLPDCPLNGVQLDSRKVRAGGLFLALAGSRGHGADYIDHAIKQGAAAVLWEADSGEGVEYRAHQGLSIPLIPVQNLRALAGVIAARFYGEPSQALTVIGITGTNGKTSVSQFIAQALNPKSPCGVIGTLGSGLWGHLVDTGHTTPDAVSVQAELAQQRDAGARSVAMEVSSHGLHQARVSGVAFDVAVFTNLSHDHLDYHGDMTAYAEAKQRLFKQPGLKVGVLNLDDATGRQWYQDLQGQLSLIGYSLDAGLVGKAELVAEKLELSAHGISMDIVSPRGRATLSSPLLGRFNASNLLAALGALLGAGLPLAEAVVALEQVRTVPGRMERFGGEGQPLVVVDYAHTPDALEQVLMALREHQPRTLLCVFGCGGDRDREKRPLMGAIAARLADAVIVTDDNPRHEDPEAIVRDIVAGMDKTAPRIIRDRAAAIAEAVRAAGPGDCVLVAGKGHETEQQVGARRLPFSDRAVVAQCLQGGVMKSGITTALVQIARWLQAERHGADVQVQGVSTDSRQLQPGQLFIALRGPNFDGHDHVEKARQAGAVAALVERRVDCELPQLVVADTRLALGALAAAWRQHCGATVVAVTGSNGKTTVKEMLAAICARHGHTLATQGNLNNDIGVPLTLLRLEPEHRYAVIEMGASAGGEIAYLTGLVRPDVALITNAAGAHLEGFGSLDGVARAKGEIFAGLATQGTAIINADDRYSALWQELAAAHAIIRFGLEKAAEVSAHWQGDAVASELQLHSPQGEAAIHLKLPGRHNVMNALAASAAALALGVPLAVIAEALSALHSVKGRLQARPGFNGAHIIDDSYNANPESLRSGIQVLSACQGRRYLALGDMAELGAEAASLHAEAGREARRAGIDRLYATGNLSRHSAKAFGEQGYFFTEQDGLIEALKHALAEDVTVLVKGSRSAGMERVAQALVNGGNA